MKKIFNKVHLQIIAVIAMTIDHIAWLIFPGYSHHPVAILCHILGRIAFPIMAFFIAEGYHYTKDKKKYILRLFIFSLISHIPYMLTSISFNEYGWLSLIPFCTGVGITRFLNQTSVLFAYLIGLLMLCVNNSKKLNSVVKTLLILLLALVAFPSDWSSIASLIVLAIGSSRDNKIKQLLLSAMWIGIYIIVYYFALDKIYALIQLGVLLTIPLLMLYNGKKSKSNKVNKTMKWFFYIYYPLHLLILGVIGLFI